MKQLANIVYHIILKKTKRNYFFILSNLDGMLQFYITLKFKNKVDMTDKRVRYKLTLSNFLTRLIRRRVRYVIVDIYNFEMKLIKPAYYNLKNKCFYVLYLRLHSSTPHNGCRKELKARIHKKRKFKKFNNNRIDDINNLEEL